MHYFCTPCAENLLSQTQQRDTLLSSFWRWHWRLQRSGIGQKNILAYSYRICTAITLPCPVTFQWKEMKMANWWECLPVSGDAHLIKKLAITILSIVPHAAEVKHLFSSLSGIQTTKKASQSTANMHTCIHEKMATLMLAWQMISKGRLPGLLHSIPDLMHKAPSLIHSLLRESIGLQTVPVKLQLYRTVNTGWYPYCFCFWKPGVQPYSIQVEFNFLYNLIFQLVLQASPQNDSFHSF